MCTLTRIIIFCSHKYNSKSKMFFWVRHFFESTRVGPFFNLYISKKYNIRFQWFSAIHNMFNDDNKECVLSSKQVNKMIYFYIMHIFLHSCQKPKKKLTQILQLYLHICRSTFRGHLKKNITFTLYILTRIYRTELNPN